MLNKSIILDIHVKVCDIKVPDNLLEVTKYAELLTTTEKFNANQYPESVNERITGNRNLYVAWSLETVDRGIAAAVAATCTS
jgi:hypothetical protein